MIESSGGAQCWQILIETRAGAGGKEESLCGKWAMIMKESGLLFGIFS